MCLHNSIILSKEDENRWLHLNLTNAEINRILIPSPNEKMDAYIIDNNFF